MSDGEKKPEKPESGDWKLRASGLYLPEGVPDGGKKAPVGFSAALPRK